MAVETVEEILRRWNKPPVDNDLAYVLGEVADREDGRETKATDNPNAHEIQDNKVQYTDDGDDDDDDAAEDYSDEDTWTFQALKDEIDRRNADRDDDKISKGGGRDDLVARLVEDDAAAGDDD